MSEKRRVYLEALRSTRFLQLHAVSVVLVMIVLALIQATLAMPAYNPISLSQVKPEERAEFIADALASAAAYARLVEGIGRAITWSLLGLGLAHAVLITNRGGWRPLGLLVVVLGVASGAVVVYGFHEIYSKVYDAVVAELSKPEVAEVLTQLSVHVSPDTLKPFMEALARAFTVVKPTLLDYAAGIMIQVALVASIVLLEPIIRTIRSLWPRLLQVLLIMVALTNTLSLLPDVRRTLGVIASIIGLASLLEPVAAWLTASRIKQYGESVMAGTG